MASSSKSAHETMSESVPIFLKKTYHMIDSCDAEIAGWDEDGLTFTVKDPVLFETTIIPQFFKHSKFTSFVRQLNFYSFRKIKCSDSIRIDLETEKRTANYWRFRHDHFRRGRADLLTEIKRMNGKNVAPGPISLASGSVGAATLSSAKNTAVVPMAVSSSSSGMVALAATNVTDKEVLKLKKRIDEMTKNMDKLTEMVEKVSLQQEACKDDALGGGDEQPDLKRKKHTVDETLTMDYSIVPDVALSQFAMEELAALPLTAELAPSPPPIPTYSPVASRETSDEFVEQLFQAFENDGESDWLPQDSDIDTNSDDHKTEDYGLNRPDPELMKQLSDALALLPRDVQEMIITRLIAAITSPDGGFNVVPALVPPTTTESLMQPMTVPSSTATIKPEKPDAATSSSSSSMAAPVSQAATQQPLPLAAATLAALLHHYSNQVKEQQAAASNAAVQQQSAQTKKTLKSLPVIPVHA